MCGVKGQTDGQRGGGKAAINEKLTQHLSLLDDCIKEGVVYIDLEASGDWCLGLSGLEAVKEWKKFMGGLVSLYAQVGNYSLGTKLSIYCYSGLDVLVIPCGYTSVVQACILYM